MDNERIIGIFKDGAFFWNGKGAQVVPSELIFTDARIFGNRVSTGFEPDSLKEKFKEGIIEVPGSEEWKKYKAVLQPKIDYSRSVVTPDMLKFGTGAANTSLHYKMIKTVKITNSKIDDLTVIFKGGLLSIGLEFHIAKGSLDTFREIVQKTPLSQDLDVQI